MKFTVIAAAIAGLTLAVYLIFYAGLGAIVAAVAAVGWGGFAVLCACSLALFLLTGSAWFALVSELGAARAATFIWGRLIRDSAGEILPFSQFGGLLIGVRALVLRGISVSVAFASTIVDVTTDLFAQIVFVLIGVVFMAKHLGTASRAGNIPVIATAGAGIALAGSVAFILLQRRGLGFTQRLAARWLPRAMRHTESLARAIAAIYDSPGRLAASSFIHLIGWLASAAVTLLAVRLIGVKIGFASAVAIDAMVCALRSAAIFVPAGLGVQEAGYAMLMPLFGIPAEIGLAVSLLRRGREIATGLPVLLLWQAMEGNRIFVRSPEN